MPTVRSIIDDFPDLETVSLDSLLAHLKDSKYDRKLLENELGNRILYPHITPVSKEDLKLDQALIIEAIKIHSKTFYHPNVSKIYIPEIVLNIFPSLNEVVWTFIESLTPRSINTIILKEQSGTNRNLGTYIRPEVVGGDKLLFWINEVKYEVKVGTYLQLPTTSHKVDIKFESPSSLLLEKNSLVAEIAGGEVGIIIDAR